MRVSFLIRTMRCAVNGKGKRAMFLPSGGEAIREAAEWAAFMGTGAWLRWGIIPVRAAYEVGKRMGKIRQNAMHAARQATGRRRYLLPTSRGRRAAASGPGWRRSKHGRRERTGPRAGTATNRDA